MIAEFERQFASGMRGECIMPIGKMKGMRIDAIATRFLILSLGSIQDPNRREHFPNLEAAMCHVLDSRAGDEAIDDEMHVLDAELREIVG